MDSLIRFQHGLAVSDSEKQSDVSSDKIEIFKTPKELIDKYISPLLQNKYCIDNDVKFFNEYSKGSHIKLFWDVDLKKNDFVTNDVYQKYFLTLGEPCSFSHSQLYFLKDLITDFIKFLNKKKNFTFMYSTKKDCDVNITPAELKKGDELFKEILENVSVTYSSNKEKFSFHVFFNNIIYKKEKSSSVKKLMKDFVQRSKNPLSNSLDLMPYKSKPLLRFIYSGKNEEDKSYHMPLSITYNVNDIIIEYDDVELNEENITNYLYSYINKEKTSLEFIFNDTKREGKEIVIKEGVEPLEYTDFSIPDVSFLSRKMLLYNIFKEEELAMFKQMNILDNLNSFDDTLVKIEKNEKEVPILLQFDYTKTNCVFCNKSEHKNHHRIYVNNFGIVIIKNGQSLNCKKKAFQLPKLSERQICEWIFNAGIVKRYLNDELIAFSKLYGWQLINGNDFSIFKYILKSYSHYFKPRDMITIENMKEVSLKEHFRSISKTKPIIEFSYHNYFKFKNGILDIATGKFTEMIESVDIIVLNGVDYDYKDEKKYNENEKKKDKYLHTVIDQILPPEINSEVNINRKIFEQNCSSCILTRPKDVITVLHGPTAAGKSTIKSLIANSLGENNYLEIPISTYVYTINANKPNPWLGKAEFKLASFASEPGFNDKINSQAVKLMTEVEIQARLLNSNKQKQINCLSQFIDTNPELTFDRDDPATLRRWAVVKFQSSFKSDKTESLLTVFDNQSFKGSEDLKKDILEKKYSLIFFNIMKKWCFKYDQFKNFTMKNTAEFAHYSLFLEFFTNCFVNSLLIKDMYYIKEDAVDNYKIETLKFRTEKKKYVTTSYHYIVEKLQNVTKNKNWDVDVISFLKQLEIRTQTRTIYTYILLSDIREDFLGEVIKEYNIQRKNKSEKEITLDYYNANKDLTKGHLDNIKDE